MSKMRCWLICVLAGALVVTGCQTAVGPRVTPVENVQAGGPPGVPYALPRHRIELTCKVARTSTKLTSLGEDVKADTSVRAWVKKYLGVDLDEIENGDTYKLKSATAARTIEADPSKTYVVGLQGTAMEERSLSMTMSTIGLMTSVTASSVDKTPEIVGKVVKSIGSVVGSVIGLSVAGTVSKSDRDTMLDGDDLKGPKKALTAIGGDRETLLALLAKKVYLESKIDEALRSVGDANPETLKFVVEMRKQQLASLPAAFYEQKTKEYAVTPPALLPVKGDPCEPECPCGRRVCLDKACTVLWISSEKGVRLADQAVYVDADLRTGDEAGKWTAVELLVASKPCRPQFVDVVADALNAQAVGGGLSLRYRVPRQTEVAIQLRAVDPLDRSAACLCCEDCSIENSACLNGPCTEPVAANQDDLAKPVFRLTMGIAQLGEVLALPLRVGGNIKQYEAEFHETIGALTKITVASTPVDVAALAEGVAGGATTILDAAAARKKAKIAARTSPKTADELQAELQARLTRLVEIQKLIAALKEYGIVVNPDTGIPLPSDE